MKTCLLYPSNAKPRTPFGAACPHYGAAAPGLHADSKAVRAFASGRRRLVGSFHDFARGCLKNLLLQPLTHDSVNPILASFFSFAERVNVVDNLG